jgi:hypothetical protein
MKNALSIDLEDWFCVKNLAQAIKRDDWDKCDLRVRATTTRILDLLDRHNVRATFFILGWIADRAPDLIRDIEARGHEILGISAKLILSLVAGVLTVVLSSNTVRFGAGIAAIFFLGQTVVKMPRALFADRSFFGAYRVERSAGPSNFLKVHRVGDSK